MNRFAALLTFCLCSFVAAEEGPPPRVVPEAKKDEPKAEPAKGEDNATKDDVQQTAERIAENAKKAGERLKEKDPGADTRKIQEEIVKDIDSLIKKAQQPPPPPMSSDMSPMMPPPKSDMMPPPMPMGGTGGTGKEPKSPMGQGKTGGEQPKMGNGGTGSAGGDSKSGRKSRRERKPRGDSPMGMGDPMVNKEPGGMRPMPATWDPKGGQKEKTGEGNGDRFGKASPKRENDKLAELYKDVWGHLPERLRQEMDLYYREQFMPRYSELLRQYYAALAEQRKKGSEDR